jgi:transposase
MKDNETSALARGGRVIGLDSHPDVFTAAALSGTDAAAAQVEQVWDRWAMERLEVWARQLCPGDVVALEASGNSFAVAERLSACGVAVIILESQRAGQIRKSYCANDRVDAVKLGRIYLSGLAQIVWQPDARTRERREVLHCYRKAVTGSTRARNRLKGFLSDHGVRLKKGTRLTQSSAEQTIKASRAWSDQQCFLLDDMLLELAQAEERRRRLDALMAREVAADPVLLRLTRLIGVRHIIAYAVGAVVGDITRFANPKKLVAYLGLAPRVETSGNDTRGAQGLVSFGRGDLRALLVQSAQNALQQRKSPLHTWGWKLCLRKGHKNVAVAAIARKLTVSIWYCMRGLIVPPATIDQTLLIKMGKMATAIGRKTILQLGYSSKTAFIEEKCAVLLKPT